MSDSTGSQIPLQEAVSIISIVSILISVACYLAAINQLPLITPALWWVASCAYGLFPALARLPGAQVPILAASAAVGIAFFVFTIPFSYWLASVFTRGRIRKEGPTGNATKTLP
jgi:hypothetical protein